MFEKIQVWYISCTSGYNSCSELDQGFYKTKEEAQNLVPDVVMVDEHNRPVRVRGTELEGEIG